MSKDSNTVYIGQKPTMNYVLAVLTYINSKDAKEVIIKARGQAISAAVDVAEIVNKRFMKELGVSKISIGTEEMPPREGENRNRNVSTIEITMTRQ
ncbi:DNA-binding protein Alba [Candidatus Bathyarchaeota archaeon]|nr:DNA-binding protein Alba [Candidatus Bathyarchaeota archaeon]